MATTNKAYKDKVPFQVINRIKNHNAGAALPTNFDAGELGIITTSGSERIWVCFDGANFVKIPFASIKGFYTLGGSIVTSGTSYVSATYQSIYTDFLYGDVSIYFESNLIAGSGGTTYADLYDSAGGATVTGSEISSTSATYERKRSGAITLSKNKLYYPRTKHAVAAGTAYACKIVVL